MPRIHNKDNAFSTDSTVVYRNPMQSNLNESCMALGLGLNDENLSILHSRIHVQRRTRERRYVVHGELFVSMILVNLVLLLPSLPHSHAPAVH
eukprot:751704-Hanusia_phi.AAC.6